MDQKQFEDLLSTVCEWHRPDPALYVERLGRERKSRKVIKPDDHINTDTFVEDQAEIDDTEDSTCDLDFSGETHGDPEPSVIDPAHAVETYPIRIQELKIQPKTCGDCGRHCEKGRRIEKKIYKTEIAHWRTRCATCNKYKNPYTGKYDVHPHGMVRIYTAWCRGAIIRPSTIENYCELDAQG